MKDNVKSGVVAGDFRPLFRKIFFYFLQHEIMFSFIYFAHAVQMLFKISSVYKIRQQRLDEAGNRTRKAAAQIFVLGKQCFRQNHIAGADGRRHSFGKRSNIDYFIFCI